MTTFQLSCAHWQPEPDAGRYSTGALLPCNRCGGLRRLIIGYATTATAR